MNFLAHLFLSGNDEPLIVGNFLGDFLSNKQVATLPRPFQEGVRLHRKIDSFTDQHPMVKQSSKRLQPLHGKYAPVILDVFHDFLLAHNWGKFSPQPLGDFAYHIYLILQHHLYLMPPFLKERLPLMIADDWLVRYGTEEGLRFTFDRMKLRSSFPRFFENAVESLQKDFDALNEEFLHFFPEAVAMAKGWDERNF
jgi:acyl carrier protein phosphodiesterase